MRRQEDFTEKAIRAILSALGPYLNEVVVCGSWTNFIYRHWMTHAKGPDVVRTFDLDLAVRGPLPFLGRSLTDQLRIAGFKARKESPTRPLWSEDTDVDMEPRKTVFELKESPYLEFIMPSSANAPRGSIREIQTDVGAACLEYVELLVENTRTAEVRGTQLRIRVATPGAYVFQKMLTYTDRNERDKKGKDLANVFDVLNEFPTLHDELLGDLKALVRKYPKEWWEKLHKHVSRDFASPDAEGVGLLVAQNPPALQSMLASDVTNGMSLFRETAYGRFSELLRAIGSP